MHDSQLHFTVCGVPSVLLHGAGQAAGPQPIAQDSPQPHSGRTAPAAPGPVSRYSGPTFHNPVPRCARRAPSTAAPQGQAGGASDPAAANQRARSAACPPTRGRPQPIHALCRRQPLFPHRGVTGSAYRRRRGTRFRPAAPRPAPSPGRPAPGEKPLRRHRRAAPGA